MNDRLLDWAVQLAVAEELARRKAETVEIVGVEAPRLSSRIIDRRNVTIKGEELILRELGCGVLDEFMVKAEDTDFRVIIKKDGETTVFGKYNEYAEVSQDVEGIDAYQEYNTAGEPTGAYVLKINDIAFAKNLTIKITTTKPVKFRAIFCKYKVKT
ncbi:MAG: hypothetical protein QXY39_07305 [Thermofilaceae archaeon]